MSHAPWVETDELPPATTWLLEASAGTGKTFQIASLVVRLVAEYGLPIERILAITFTHAAAAELRDRVRSRLREARDCVREPTSHVEDPVFRHLLALGRRNEVEARLELALRTFDLAPISTIHGFSQRLLEDFAFDSGQDSDLELVPDATDITDQLVDDALATIYAEASALEVGLLATAGVTRANLRVVARSMTGPTEPGVVPAAQGAIRETLRQTSSWARETARFAALFRGDVARRAREELARDIAAKLLHNVRAGTIARSFGVIDAWLSQGAPRRGAEETKAFDRLALDSLERVWKGSAADFPLRPWHGWLAQLAAFAVEHTRFWGSFAPLASFAASVRARVDAELARRRALTFDGVLARLAERVARTADGSGAALVARIRERFDAVFVDEFQDTDEAQWSVIRTAFHRHRRLFLIGDPKQAIYSFRGADVHVYLGAAELVDASRRRTMTANWRSDPPAVEALNALFRADSGAFDQPAMDYIAVTPRSLARLEPARPGLALRWLDARVRGEDDGAPLSAKDLELAADLAAREARSWLDGERSRLRLAGQLHDVQPADLAVLVNDRHEARAMREAFERVGIPAVAASKASVFDTEVAVWLAAWLDAVATGGRDREARSVVTSPLFGWTADDLAWALYIAERGEEAERAAHVAEARVLDWSGFAERLRRASESWALRGFARTFDHEASEGGVYVRVLSLPGGERHATDLRHLFELLHVEDRTHRASPAALADWLRAQVGTESDATVQRLESDARAVRIETIHLSKGLEYPVVLLPFAWAVRREIDHGVPFVVRGTTGPELHVGAQGSALRERARTEQVALGRREALRKLYVALTRARHHTITWYGPVGSEGKRTSATPVGRLLMRTHGQSGFDDAAMPQFKKGEADAWRIARSRLDELAARSAGSIEWRAETPLSGQLQPWTPPGGNAISLRTAAWSPDRSGLSGPWIVASYSGLAASSAARDLDDKLTADARIALGVTLDPGFVPRAENGASWPKPAFTPFEERARLALGGGTQYGTWVHAVFEHLDFATARGKDGASLDVLVVEQARALGLAKDAPQQAELVRQLPALLATPLGSNRPNDLVRGLPPDFTLADISDAQRKDELTFDLRLGDGTAWQRTGRDESAIGRVDPQKVDEALFSGGVDPYRPAAAAWLEGQRERRVLGQALIGRIVGILTGSIDLVFRTHSRAGEDIYYFADYKTNRIDESRSGHYAAGWLDWKMGAAGYPLQSLIYTVALHRHLRTRLSGYDYDRHFGGYLYLFLRGMSGSETPRDPATGRCLGVFGDRWPKEVVVNLDAALAPGAGKGAS